MPSILIVTNRAPWPLRDGGAMAMHQMIRGYRQQGWQVHLLSMNTTRHAMEESVLNEVYADLDSVSVVPFDNRLRPVRLVRNLLTSRQPEHAERFYDAGFERTLLEVVARAAPDVIQFESLFLTGYVRALRHATDAPLILRLHNIEHQIWARAAVAASGAKRIYLRSLARRMKRYEEWAWGQYDLLLPITREDEGAVRASCRTIPLHFMPYGITTEAALPRTTQSETQDYLKLYHLGAMDWLPNREAVSWFIHDVWPRIRSTQPSAEFHFAGRSLEAGFCAPLPAGVFNHGVVSDAAAFIAGKGVLVVPLRAGGGIRVKILEAMAAGKLVISTSVGIQGIDAAAGEHFLPANSVEEFGAAVEWAAGHPSEAQRIAESAQALVREVYDASTLALGLSTRVQTLVEGSTQSGARNSQP